MCSRMRKPLAAVEEQHRAWLEVARLCADDEQTWALEVSFQKQKYNFFCASDVVETHATGCGGSCCTTISTTCRALCC